MSWWMCFLWSVCIALALPVLLCWIVRSLGGRCELRIEISKDQQ